MGNQWHPKIHAPNHQAGGIDVLNVAGLAGLLVTPQTPILHAATHQALGADLLNVAGLVGLLATPQTPIVHGPAFHTDRARTLVVPCGIKYTGSARDWGRCSVADLDPLVNEYLEFTYDVPDDFVTFTSLELVWGGFVGGTLGFDWRMRVSSYWAACSEAYNTHTESPADVTLDVAAASTKYCTDLLFTFAALAPGDNIGTKLTRVAVNVNDTWETEIAVLELRFNYTAIQ